MRTCIYGPTLRFSFFAFIVRRGFAMATGDEGQSPLLPIMMSGIKNEQKKRSQNLWNGSLKARLPAPLFQPALNAVSDSGALVIGYDRPEQPLDLISEACRNLGFVLGDVLYLAINCAAHDLMDYVSEQWKKKKKKKSLILFWCCVLKCFWNFEF